MKPRQDTSGWEYTKNAYTPNNVMQLTGGYFAVNGMMGNRFQSGDALKPLPYTTSEPLRNTWANKSAATDTSYGYINLYDDELLAGRIDGLARKHDIDGQWLADSLAMATRGTFDVRPYTDTPKDVPPHVALSRVVTPLLDMTGTQSLQKGAEIVTTALVANPDVAKRLADEPKLATRLNNGYINMQNIWDALGSHAGRVYDHSNNRLRKLSWSVVHTDHHQGCRWCRALQDSGNPHVPHEYQP